MSTDEVIALLEAHESIVVEREEAKEMMDCNEFSDGHINGLNEARNRIEECIINRIRES
jgi:hypothetical protein